MSIAKFGKAAVFGVAIRGSNPLAQAFLANSYILIFCFMVSETFKNIVDTPHFLKTDFDGRHVYKAAKGVVLVERAPLRILQRPLISIVKNHLVDYPTASNINYWWGFGSLAGIFLSFQLFTGIFLAMHYTPHVDLAFASVEHIMRDVNFGWFLRYLHANGASFFFFAIYVHIFRGLYASSYAKPRGLIWGAGVIIFILMMATGFLGYVLPWGQMSLWAATVITNLFSAIPVVGLPIVEWLWGGFSVDNACLNRFYSLHYLLPFVLTALVLVHLNLLHNHGSNNPLGVNASVDKLPFFPFFFLKDVFGWLFFLYYLLYLCFFFLIL